MSCHVSHRSVSSTGQSTAQRQGLGAFANSLQEIGTLENSKKFEAEFLNLF